MNIPHNNHTFLFSNESSADYLFIGEIPGVSSEVDGESERRSRDLVKIAANRFSSEDLWIHPG